MKFASLWRPALLAVGLLTSLVAQATPYTLRVPLSGLRPAGGVAASPGSSDPYLAEVALLMHGDGANGATTIPADIGATPVNVNTRLSTASKQFGPSAMYFDGTASLTVPAGPATNWGTGDFTVEGWFNATVWGSNETLFSYGNYVWEGYLFVRILSGSLGLGWCSAGSTSNCGWASGPSVSLNTWHHLAWERASGMMLLFLDGKKVATLANAWNLQTTGGMRIGAGDYSNNAFSPAYQFTGYLDEVRLTPGVVRYTSDFTPPAQAF